MSNYASSLLTTGQAMLTGAFANSELRYRNPVVFNAFLKSSQFMFPSIMELKTSDQRAVEAYYTKRTSRALGSNRAYNHTGSKGDSGALSLSFTTKTDKFYKSLKQADRNVITEQAMFNNELQNAIANFAEGLESSAIDHLFSNRSEVNVATVEGTFEATNFVFEVADTKEARMAQIMKSIMGINKYNGVYDVFCDTLMFNKLEYNANQGTGNSNNLSFQYANMNFIYSPELDSLASDLDATYVKGFALVAPVGTYGVVDWIPKQNRAGLVTSVNTYGTIINPVDGLTYAVHSYETRADENSNGGERQDVKTEFELSIDLSFNHAPLSTANETTIQAFAIV